MARLAQIACAATVILTASAVPLCADPINIAITSGSIFVGPPGTHDGPATIQGTRGFTFTGTAGFFTGEGLFSQCMFPECPPGTRVNFNLDMSGDSGFLTGQMTIDGNSYPVTDAIDANARLFLHIDGSFIAPAMGPARTTIAAPFSLTGDAHAVGPRGETLVSATLIGRGIGTASLVPFNPAAGFPPSWVVDNVRFDFAQPTPEPSTLILLGTCAAGAFMRRRRSFSPPSPPSPKLRRSAEG
jgi:PEP-CTERM motif